MTLIEIPDDQAAAWKARAEAEGLTLEAWIAKLANDVAGQPAETTPVQPAETPRRHISEVIREIMADVPPEVWEAMPTDGASQHDHYLYGWPKRES